MLPQPALTKIQPTPDVCQTPFRSRFNNSHTTKMTVSRASKKGCSDFDRKSLNRISPSLVPPPRSPILDLEVTRRGREGGRLVIGVVVAAFMRLLSRHEGRKNERRGGSRIKPRVLNCACQTPSVNTCSLAVAPAQVGPLPVAGDGATRGVLDVAVQQT